MTKTKLLLLVALVYLTVIVLLDFLQFAPRGDELHFWPTALSFSRRYTSARGASAVSQSSSAACSVAAIRGTATARARSRDTTTSRPSRLPSLSVASFMLFGVGSAGGDARGYRRRSR